MRGQRPVGHSAGCHRRFADLLRDGDDGDRRRVERAEAGPAEAVMWAAQEEIRRVGEHAERAVDRAAEAAREGGWQRSALEPASAEAGIDMEDTTFLYGPDAGDGGVVSDGAAASSSSSRASAPEAPQPSTSSSQLRSKPCPRAGNPGQQTDGGAEHFHIPENQPRRNGTSTTCPISPAENWCEHCARCKCLSFLHKKINSSDRHSEDVVPTISRDLCYMRMRFQQVAMPIVVLRDGKRGETRAHGLLSTEISIEQGSYVVQAIVGIWLQPDTIG